MWQIILIFLETILLSLAFYLVPKKYIQRHRNDHTVITVRTTILVIFIVFINILHKWIFSFNTISVEEIWGLFNPLFLLPILSATIHTLILFSGTIMKIYFYTEKSGKSFWKSLLDYCSYFYDPFIDIRNLITCPILEELMYRGSILTFLLNCHYSLRSSIWISSIAFGSCHFHHITESVREGRSVFASILQSLIMFIYTTLFGVLASYIYVRTGSLAAAIVVHALCNFFSIPSFEYLRPHSIIYEKRKYITLCYVIGVVLYISLFTCFLNASLFKSPFLSILI